MIAVNWFPEDAGAVYNGNNVCVLPSGWATLVCRDANNNPVPPGYGLFPASAEFLMRNASVEALQDWLAVEAEVDEPAGTEVELWGSNNGSTFFQLRGSGGSYNDGLFYLIGDKFQLKAILKASADRTISPSFRNVFLYGKGEVSIGDDILRSVRRWIAANARLFVKMSVVFTGPVSTELKIDYPLALDLAQPIGAWAIGSEGNRILTNNLYQSFDSGTKVMTFNTPVSVGTPLAIYFYAVPEVQITPDPEFIKSHLPLYVLRLDSMTEYPETLQGDEQIVNDATKYGFTMPRPISYDATVVVDCVAGSEIGCQQLVGALNKLIQGMPHRADRLESVAAGYPLDVIEVAPSTDVSDIPNALHDHQVRFLVGGKVYRGGYEQSKLAEIFEFDYNGEAVIVSPGD